MRPNIVFLLIFTSCNEHGDIRQPPEGMVYFIGGEITIGADNTISNEGPAFRATVGPFFIDIHPVTVAQFNIFVQETGYVTDAERFGNSAVVNMKNGEWELIDGACWKYPFGRDGPPAPDDHPVTQVSWNDANTYARWTGRRLPTEIEWEYAAKSGKGNNDRYSWGNSLVKNGTYMANVWQGNFPDVNTLEDGFEYTSPVGAFGKTEAGLTDMGGNVWEWTADTYRLYEGNPYQFQENPASKVIRGGSFLCHKSVCWGYRTSARQFNSRESATFHMGFRTVKDVR
jgi:formylglycine-generating enzyme